MDKRIGFGPRLGAALIDFLIVCAAIVVIGPLLGGLLGAAALSEASKEAGDPAAQGAIYGGLLGALGGLLFGGPIIGALYFLVEGVTGYTVGKLALGIRIGTAEMTPAPIPKLLLRFCCKHPHFVLGTLGAFTFDALSRLGGLLGVVAFFGCFLALGEKKQALHDLIAGTAVYPKAALEPAPQPAA